MKKLKRIWAVIMEKPIRWTLGNPYSVGYSNDTDKELGCVLFGYNDYCMSPNYGTDPQVEVVNLNGGTYGRLINQSAWKNFTIGIMRITSENGVNLRQVLKINNKNANGVEWSGPMNLMQIKDLYQFNEETIESTKKIFIDSNIFLTFKIQPKSKIEITAMPLIVDNSPYPTMRERISNSKFILKIKFGWQILKNKLSAAKIWIKNKLKRKA
jgi:hypothetical protein